MFRREKFIKVLNEAKGQSLKQAFVDKVYQLFNFMNRKWMPTPVHPIRIER